LRELSTKIKETAGQLVQIVDGTAPEDLITVNSFQSTPPEPLPEAGIATQTMGWIAGSWQTLVVIGLVIFSLMMLRSFLKSIPASAPSEPIAAAHESDADESDSGPDTVRFGGYSEEKSVRDELADMVKHDPDAAAAILRSWISTPA